MKKFQEQFKGGSLIQCTFVKEADGISRRYSAVGSLTGQSAVYSTANGTLYSTRVLLSGMPADVEEGVVLMGQVKRILPHEGLLVSLPGLTGRVDMTDLFDCYVEDPLQNFKKSQLVQ